MCAAGREGWRCLAVLPRTSYAPRNLRWTRDSAPVQRYPWGRKIYTNRCVWHISASGVGGNGRPFCGGRSCSALLALMHLSNHRHRSVLRSDFLRNRCNRRAVTLHSSPVRRRRPGRVMVLGLFLTLTATLPVISLEPPGVMVETFSVRDEPVKQVLLAFAEQAGVSVVTDETVDGTVSVVLHQRDARSMILEIAEAANLIARTVDGTIYLSRLHIQQDDEGRWSLQANGASRSAIIRALSRVSGRTILISEHAGLPVDMTVPPTPLGELLETLATAWNQDLHRRGQGFFFVRSQATGDESRIGSSEIHLWEEDGWHLTASRAPRGVILEQVYRASDQVFTIASPSGDSTFAMGIIDQLELKAPTLEQLQEQMLRHLGLASFKDGKSLVLYPYGQEGRLEAFQSRAMVVLKGITIQELRDAITRRPGVHIEAVYENLPGIILRGLPSAIDDALELINLLETMSAQYRPLIIPVWQSTPQLMVAGLRASFPTLEFTAVSNRSEITARAPETMHDEIRRVAARIDRQLTHRLYQARHIPAKELAQLSQGHATSAGIALTADGNGLVLTGEPGSIRETEALLQLLDTPREQLRFDVCIIQYQSSFSSHRGTSASVQRDASSAQAFTSETEFGVNFDRLFSLQFDMLSTLGYNAALAISGELGTNNARLMVDTSLRAENGAPARLENATTYRYRDQTELRDAYDRPIIGVTREIDSGLTIELTGWLHRDRTITVDITVSVSKQGADLTGRGNPPPTSRKVIESTLRVAAGEPIIIGGLLQQERTSQDQRMPALGRIPILRNLLSHSSRTEEETEMVLYLAVFPDRPEHPREREERQLQTLTGLIR